ncbi:MAG TPA: dienelactone hydrolase family protein [Thermodesulfobacteriota bacterium]
MAVQPVSAQTMIVTDTQGLDAGEVRIPVRDGTMAAYRAMPASGTRFPVVLVISEIFGVHQYIQDTCRRLAKRGYCAVAPALYAKYGDVSTLPDAQTIIREVVSKASDEEIASYLDSTLAWAGQESKADLARAGITGFCWGGRVTWMYAAHNPSLKAGVAWYGRLTQGFHPGSKNPIDIAASLTVPVLGLYGGADTGIPLSDVEKMQAELAKGSSGSQIHVYPDAPHAFHADYRPTYRKEAAEDGWARMLDWFKRHGVA